jgi:hypothetical protein
MKFRIDEIPKSSSGEGQIPELNLISHHQSVINHQSLNR